MKINDQQQLVFYLDKPCRLNRSYGALYAPIVFRQQITALLLVMQSILNEFMVATLNRWTMGGTPVPGPWL